MSCQFYPPFDQGKDVLKADPVCMSICLYVCLSVSVCLYFCLSRERMEEGKILALFGGSWNCHVSFTRLLTEGNNVLKADHVCLYVYHYVCVSSVCLSVCLSVGISQERMEVGKILSLFVYDQF